MLLQITKRDETVNLKRKKKKDHVIYYSLPTIQKDIPSVLTVDKISYFVSDFLLKFTID